MSITVFSVVYNNYGRFIPQWVEYMSKQSLKPELIIILGKNHGADLEYLKENNITYKYVNSEKMGVLRNSALKMVKTDWWLYFSIDDELLPSACEYIVNSGAEAVSIMFDIIEPDGTIKKQRHSPFFKTKNDLNNWKKFWGGYVAVKGNIDIRFNEDIEVPNLTLHFELFKRRLKIIQSERSLIVHHRWAESHHFRSKDLMQSFYDEIESVKLEILKEMDKELSKEKYLVIANDEWIKKKVRDSQIDEIPVYGREWEVDGVRLYTLLGDNRHKTNFILDYRKL